LKPTRSKSPTSSSPPSAKPSAGNSSKAGTKWIPTATVNSPGLRCTHSTSSGPPSTENPRHGQGNTPQRSTDTGRNGLDPKTTSPGNKSGTEFPRDTTADLSGVLNSD